MKISEKELENICRKLLNNVVINKVHPINDINLFSILNMENKEVSAHSKFLYYIFLPFIDENGNKDDKNLRELFKQLHPNVAKPDFIDIQQEVVTDFGRLDFLVLYEINGKKDASVIELKIWAQEQPNQISRYKDYMISKGFNANNIFFLTPTERKSQTGESINILLNREIKEALKAIITIRNNSNYTSVINQYINIIEKLSGENKMENQIESAKDIIAVGKLYNQRQEALEIILSEFMQNLESKLKSNSFFKNNETVFEFVDSTKFEKGSVSGYYTSSSKTMPIIPLKVNKKYLQEKYKTYIDENVDMYFVAEIDYKLYCAVTLKTNYNDGIKATDIPDKIIEVLGLNNKAGSYMAWDYVKCNNNLVDFNNYEHNTNGILNLLEEGTLTISDNHIEQICDDIIDKFKEYSEKFLII